MNERRTAKLKNVIQQSQPDLTVVLENIYDPLNVSAVLRTCDAVGVREVFVVYTKQYLNKRGLVLGKRTSAGTYKWIDVYSFTNLEECFRRVKERYGRILATHLGEESKSLYALDLTQPTALLFGNEDDGISKEALEMCDGNFLIPQAGFAESLNISVACAITLFEARRQRETQGFYGKKSKLSEVQQTQLFGRWEMMLKEEAWYQQMTIAIDPDSEPILPIHAERPPHIPKFKSLPLTKFEL
jgi:tRNA (guanosine-2'-O-)-methyltransferase